MKIEASSPPFIVNAPREQRVPFVVASPHSGATYPADFIKASQLEPAILRLSEDCFVDELFASAPEVGIPLIAALFPRAYVDANREPWELDPAMFADELPDWINRDSPRVAAGLGTIARVVADGHSIYRDKLLFAEAQRRVAQYYEPYHAALEELVQSTVQQFGYCILLDAHSMPSATGAGSSSLRRRRVDFVFGDRQGTSCHPALIEAAERTIRRLGYSSARNAPYAGGYTTTHYGQPKINRHCLQIEINRDLYMDERSLLAKSSLPRLKDELRRFLTALAELDLSPIAAEVQR